MPSHDPDSVFLRTQCRLENLRINSKQIIRQVDKDENEKTALSSLKHGLYSRGLDPIRVQCKSSDDLKQ